MSINYITVHNTAVNIGATANAIGVFWIRCMITTKEIKYFNVQSIVDVIYAVA